MNQTPIAATVDGRTAEARDKLESTPSLPRWLIGPILRIARVVNPIVLLVAGRRFMPIALVSHSGRRSGRHYANPVIAFPTRDGFVITLPYGSGAQWCQNVLTRSPASIRWRGIDYPIQRAKVVGPGEALPLFSPALRQLVWIVRIRQFLIVNATPQAGKQPPA